MNAFIVVRGNERTVKFKAKNDGTINEHTLRAAFLLEDDVPIGLFRNDIALESRRESDTLVFELESEWIGAEFELKWEDARRSRPVRHIEQSAPPPKKQRIEPNLEELPVDGDLAAKLRKYALYYVNKENNKRNVVPLTPRLAAMFRHGENKSIEEGDEIVIRSSFDEKFEVSTRAVKFIETFDTIILQSDGADLCDKELLRCDSIRPEKGMHYLLMGFSTVYNKNNHLLLSNGTIVAESRLKLRFAGSSCFFEGGGSCWDRNGQLIGMQIEMNKVKQTKNDDGRPASLPSGGRCFIVPTRDLYTLILDLLPPDDDDYADWNE